MGFSEIISELNFSEEGTYGWGIINNYPVVMEELDDNEVMINLYCKLSGDSDSITQMLVIYKEKGLILEGGFAEASVELIIKTDLELENATLILNELVSKLNELGAKASCDICQETEIVQFCKYEGAVVPVCETCIKLLDQVKEPPKVKSNNVLWGLLLAIAGAALSGAFIVCLRYFNFPYPPLGGALVLYLSALGYKYSNSKVSPSTHIYVIAISLFAIVLSIFAANDLMWMRESKYSNGEVLIKTFSLIFVDMQLLLNFIKDLGIAILLSLTFGYDQARALNKEPNTTSNFKRL